MPTTNVGIPMVNAVAIACTAPVVSSACWLLLFGMQFGRPSVASRMYFGLVSALPRRYVAAAETAKRVGVAPPGMVPLIAVVFAMPLFWPGATCTMLFTAHWLRPLGSEKNFRPQRTSAWVW